MHFDLVYYWDVRDIRINMKINTLQNDRWTLGKYGASIGIYIHFISEWILTQYTNVMFKLKYSKTQKRFPMRKRKKSSREKKYPARVTNPDGNKKNTRVAMTEYFGKFKIFESNPNVKNAMIVMRG